MVPTYEHIGYLKKACNLKKRGVGEETKKREWSNRGLNISVDLYFSVLPL